MVFGPETDKHLLFMAFGPETDKCALMWGYWS